MPAASPPRRKPPARKPVVKARAVIDRGDFEPLHFETPDQPQEAERVVIAYLDDYELTMPAEVPPNVALKVMRTTRRQGNEAAMVEMLEEVLGAEAFDRLVNWKALTVPNLTDLFLVVQKVSMGALETPKSGSRNG